MGCICISNGVFRSQLRKHLSMECLGLESCGFDMNIEHMWSYELMFLYTCPFVHK